MKTETVFRDYRDLGKADGVYSPPLFCGCRNLQDRYLKTWKHKTKSICFTGFIGQLIKIKFWSLIKANSDVLTASGCARPRCHVIAICTQDWLTSGRVAMIISMVTASLSFGGGCLMVQGVLGTQAHQSN